MKKSFSETDIWTLLESHDFSQLSEAQKAQVQVFLSDKEYQQMRELKLVAEKQLPAEIASLELRPNMAKEIFEQGKKKRKSLLKRLALYQVPAWQAAAVALFLAFSFYAWGNSSNTLQQTTHPYDNTRDSLLGISLAEDSSLSRFLIESL